MLTILEEFNQQQTQLQQIKDEIDESHNKISSLEKQVGAILTHAHTESDVLCDALDAAGLIDYQIQPKAYNQQSKPYTITRIVHIGGFPVLVELHRKTGVLLLDGKPVTA